MAFTVQNEWKSLSTSAAEADIQRAKNVLKTNLLLKLDGKEKRS